LFGRKDFYDFNPEDVVCEEKKFNTVLEYLDIEASRSKVLLTSTRQGKVVNDICLQIHESLRIYGARFTLTVEAIYKMAVIKLTVISESVDQVLMPIIEQNLNSIAEVEIFQWSLDDSIVLIFIDNVFEEVTPDDAVFLFEHDEYTSWIKETVEEDPMEFEDLCDDEDLEEIFDSDDNYYRGLDNDVQHNAEPYNHEKAKEALNRLLPDNSCFLINQEKLAISNQVYYQLRKILDSSKAKYTIEFLDDHPCGSGWISIQVVTDAFDPKDCDNTIEPYRYIVNNVDLMRQNTYNGKIVMTFTIRDVYISLLHARSE